MNPNKLISSIDEQTLYGRADYCRAFLAVNGFLIDSDNKRVSQRIKTFLKTNGRTTRIPYGESAAAAIEK